MAEELEVERFAHKVHERWGAADVLVNNAGISFIARAENISAKDFRRVPMGRLAIPDDIAQAIAFLADEKQSGYVNGHTLTVDGGWTADGSWKTLRLRHR